MDIVRKEASEQAIHQYACESRGSTLADVFGFRGHWQRFHRRTFSWALTNARIRCDFTAIFRVLTDFGALTGSFRELFEWVFD